MYLSYTYKETGYNLANVQLEISSFSKVSKPQKGYNHFLV